MYVRGGVLSDGRVLLKKGDVLSLDTYYNAFCHTKYRRFTTVEAVSFRARIRGRAEVRLMLWDGSQCRCVAEGEQLRVDITGLPEGILYPEITAPEDCELLGGEYLSDCSPRDIGAAVAICTYKREDYVLRSIGRFRNAEFPFIKRVFISDNGNTLDFAALSDDFIKVLPNRNFGGSGGFTRGLIEASEAGFSHIILMDDDVEFHTETLAQMTAFAALLKPEFEQSWLSTAMIPTDTPWLQYEMGAEWNGSEALVHKHNTDISDKAQLLRNLDNDGVEYGGWWTLLMPLSVTENGLPLPLFIKFDDVEYGLRKPAGTEIITMNGVAVRHEHFDKKKSLPLDYYNLRNRLIVNAVHGRMTAFGAAKRVMYEVGKNLMLYRYDNIPLSLWAARDFLRGVDFLCETDEERLNAELMRQALQLGELSDIPQWDESMRCDNHEQDKSRTLGMALSLGGHLLPPFMLDKSVAAVPLPRTGTRDCYKKRAVIQYQPETSKGVLTKRSFGKFLKYGFLGTVAAVRLLLGYKKAARDWQSRYRNITSFGFWKEHLGL